MGKKIIILKKKGVLFKFYINSISKNGMYIF